jgi:hypothetical protein
MWKNYKTRWAVMGAAFLLAVYGAQTAGPSQLEPPARPDFRSGKGLDTPQDRDPLLAAKRQKALNAARQKKLVEDTNKLLALARELDAEVQAGNEAGLTPAQGARLASIEKLAHQVKEKMIESDADLPWMNPPYTTIER